MNATKGGADPGAPLPPWRDPRPGIFRWLVSGMESRAAYLRPRSDAPAVGMTVRVRPLSDICRGGPSAKKGDGTGIITPRHRSPCPLQTARTCVLRQITPLQRAGPGLGGALSPLFHPVVPHPLRTVRNHSTFEESGRGAAHQACAGPASKGTSAAPGPRPYPPPQDPGLRRRRDPEGAPAPKSTASGLRRRRSRGASLALPAPARGLPLPPANCGKRSHARA